MCQVVRIPFVIAHISRRLLNIYTYLLSSVEYSPTCTSSFYTRHVVEPRDDQPGPQSDCQGRRSVKEHPFTAILSVD